VPPAGEPTTLLALLKAVLAAVRAPGFASEVPPMLLRLAGEIVARGALFRITKAGICGVSQFGMEQNGGNPDDTVKKVVIPLNQPSLLNDVVSSRQTYRGKLPQTAWNEFLIKKLGGPPPEDVVVIPLVVDGSAAMVFYGDGGPGNDPIREVEALEVFMNQVGLAIEKEELAKRVEAAEPGGKRTGR
jgi:hypothetical protein